MSSQSRRLENTSINPLLPPTDKTQSEMAFPWVQQRIWGMEFISLKNKVNEKKLCFHKSNRPPHSYGHEVLEIN